jgi:hypothetical protein
MRRSRAEIEEKVGGEVTMLSFPGGRMNREVVETARASGYATLFGSGTGVNRGGGGDVLKRIPVTAGTSAAGLGKLLRSPSLGCVRIRMRFGATSLARRLFGERGYNALRGRLLGLIMSK